MTDQATTGRRRAPPAGFNEVPARKLLSEVEASGFPKAVDLDEAAAASSQHAEVERLPAEGPFEQALSEDHPAPRPDSIRATPPIGTAAAAMILELNERMIAEIDGTISILQQMKADLRAKAQDHASAATEYAQLSARLGDAFRIYNTDASAKVREQTRT
jgi:hypothetical protein